jgi:hypothetical protein
MSFRSFDLKLTIKKRNAVCTIRFAQAGTDGRLALLHILFSIDFLNILVIAKTQALWPSVIVNAMSGATLGTGRRVGRHARHLTPCRAPRQASDTVSGATPGT